MRVIERDKWLSERIKSIKAEHPFWGYRKTWAYLRYREGLGVNKKRIYRLMKENNLLVTKETKLKAKRGKYPYRSKPRPTCPNQVWGMDMTKIMLHGKGWMYLMIVLDWFTKKIVSFGLSFSCKSSDWLQVLNEALNKQFPLGIRDTLDRPLELVSDNGSQPTSLIFMRTCKELNIKQIFASYNNPKGNADTERVLRTLKEDLLWIKEFTSAEELREDLERWIDNYNRLYPHFSLGLKTPLQYEEEFGKSQTHQKEQTRTWKTQQIPA